MKTFVDSAPNQEDHGMDIIVLGIASAETQGGAGAGEVNGMSPIAGISEE